MQENVVKISDILNHRYDPYFYRKEFTILDKAIDNSSFSFAPIWKISDFVVDGLHKKPEYSEERKNVAFIQISNISESHIDLTRNLKYLSQNSEKEALSRYTGKNGDVLVTKDGTIGIAARVKDVNIPFSIFVSVAAIRPKKDEIDPYFLEIVINSSIVQRQIKRAQRGAVLQHLLLEEIRNLKIPMMENQEAVITIMDKAYNLKKEKELEAKNLLASIDDFVLDALNIQLLPFKKEKAYTTQISNILGSRFDSDYNQNYYQQLQMTLENVEAAKVMTLHSLTSQQTVDTKNCNFINYVDLGSIDEDTNTINYKRIENQNIPSRAKMHIAKGDFIFSGLAGSISSIALVDRQLENMVASTGFYVIKPSDEYNVAYLFALFKTKFMQNLLVRHASGAVMPSISNIELKNIKIPFPSKDIQNKVANYVLETIREAKSLQKEANSELERAKQEVEKILLGE